MATFQYEFIEMPWDGWQKPTGLEHRITPNFYLNDLDGSDYAARAQIFDDRQTRAKAHYKSADDSNVEINNILLWPKYAYGEGYYLPFFFSGLILITAATYYPNFDMPELIGLGYAGGGVAFYCEDKQKLKNI